jgi:hypothetical protein
VAATGGLAALYLRFGQVGPCYSESLLASKWSLSPVQTFLDSKMAAK